MALELISVHFPKAGGTTFAAALKAHFGETLQLDYAHDPLRVDQGAITGLAPDADARAVHGHFRGDAYDGAAKVTFLREPVANLMSIYFFWRTYPGGPNPWREKLLAERPSIAEFAAYPPLRRLMSETYFGGVDMNSFSFVGFHETRMRDLKRFSAQFGIATDAELHLNQTEHDGHELESMRADGAIMSALRALLKEDIAFYERQQRRFS